MSNEEQEEIIRQALMQDYQNNSNNIENDLIAEEEDDNVNFTIRSTIVGLIIGSALCFSNMYFGLQTGWISMMSLQASLLGFAVFKFFYPTKSFKPKENVYLQTVAVATGTMPLAAGFVGVLPALAQLTTDDHPEGPILLSAWKMIFWSLGLSFIGVMFAVPLRKQTIIREQLRFPSGTATAQMIQVLHQKGTDSPRLRSEEAEWISHEIELSGINSSTDQDILWTESEEHQSWSLKIRLFIFSFSFSSVYTVASYFFPILYRMPLFNWLTFNLVDFDAWEWYFTPSLSYIGQGIIMGLPTTLSMLLGCTVGWGMLSPIAYYSGWATGPINDWKTGSRGWILWVSLSIMTCESIVSLLIVTGKQITASIKRQTQAYDRLETTEKEPGWVWGLILSSVGCICMVQVVFGPETMPIWVSGLSIVLAGFLSLLGVRALGETDLNPVSGIGKLSQLMLAWLMPKAIVANLIAGAISEAAAQQAGDLMQDLKTGHLLGASPQAQFYGQLIGTLLSSFVATAAYLLYTTFIPNEVLPAPTAQVWLDMARWVNGQALPDRVLVFMVGFGMAFGLMVILKEFGWGWLPQGIAFAIGMYNPPSFTLARVIGGVVGYVWSAYCEGRISNGKLLGVLDLWCRPGKKIGLVAVVIVASGFVLGEGTCSIVNMVFFALKVPHF